MPYAFTPKYWLGSTRPSIPARLDENPQVDRAIDAGVHEWPYLLHGPPGTGKTTLMCLTASMILDPSGGRVSQRTRAVWKDKRVLWTQAAEYCADVRSEIDYNRRWIDFGDDYSASGLAAYVPCLFLDDLGVEQNTDWNATTVNALIDARYRAKRPTWITTNLTLDAFKARYGDRTISRLTEQLLFWPLEGEDRRTALLREPPAEAQEEGLREWQEGDLDECPS